MLHLLASKFAKSVAASLRDHPEDWSDEWLVPGYRIVHASGVTIWIASKAWGLHVEPREGGRIYSVTDWCLVGGSPDQQAIWRAYRRWRRGRREEKALANSRDAVLRALHGSRKAPRLAVVGPPPTAA